MKPHVKRLAAVFFGPLNQHNDGGRKRLDEIALGRE